MRRAVMLSVVVLAPLSLIASAQTLLQPIRPPVVVRAPNIDPVVVLQSRMKRLENRVTSLESTLSKVEPAITYQCVDPATSRNSLGVSEECAPMGCNEIDGRCRTTAAKTDHCAPGYALWEPNVCVRTQ